ncbi:metal-dependent transcriptional regulator [Dubosiella newyorkensis]|jgi:Mn-dependent DtxR family transcriptional regulator|nr:metal-dependent transcriptional regulator [Dubosiella newyorkensis]
MNTEKKGKMKEHLGESLEDYLEAILVLSNQLAQVRSVDVASYLGFSKPSVSHAVKIMNEQGLIQLDKNKCLYLSEHGEEVAKRTYRRHVFFSEMLQQIGVPKEIAQEDACRIEHVISEETFEAIQKYYEEHEAR